LTGYTSGPESHNAILRASIRANPDAVGTVLTLRTNDVPASQARLVVHLAAGKAGLTTAATGGVGLGEWSLPRAYGADEWVRVELRAIDDDFTVLVDGQVIGTAHSNALSRPGKATLYAGANGFFRDIEYVPLDKQPAASSAPKPPVSAPSTPATSYPQPAQWTDATAGLRPQYLTNGDLVADGEWLKAAATKAFDLKWALQSRNPIVRVVFTDRVAILLRRNMNRQPKNEDTFYQAIVGHEKVAIERRDRGEGPVTILAEKYAPNQLDGAHEAVFAAQGDTLTLWLDGRLVSTARDGALTSGGLAVILTKGELNGDGRIKKVEYGELPDPAPPAVSPSPNLPAAASATKFPPGQWVKLFNKAEDLPEELRQPDSGVTWEDGWIRLNGKLESIRLSSSVFRNAGVRARIHPSAEVQTLGSLNLRSSPTGRYSFSRDRSLPINRVGIVAPASGVLRTLGTSDSKPTSAAKDHLIEFCAIGDRLIWRLDEGVPQMARNTELKEGLQSYNGTEDIRDIEVINLDGLLEAEALRLLGVDEQGNDMRGKTGASAAGEKWQNLMPLIQPATHTIKGNWEVKDGELICKASPWALCEIPVDYQGGSYDQRVTVTRGEGEQLALFFPFRKGDAAGDVVFDYFDHFSDGLKRAGLESLSRQKEEDPGNLFRMKSEWIPKGKRSTVLLQVRDEGIAVSLNGEEVFRWKADWTQLHQFRGFENALADGLNGRPVFGVGLYSCDAIYHSIEMREITGEEARLLPPAAAAK
jgi:hypothetical protein